MIHFATLLDSSILHYFAQVRTLGGAYFFIDISELASIPLIGGLAVSIGLFLALLRRTPEIAGLALSVGGSFFLTEMIKYFVQRPRPDIHFAAYLEQGYSFPSGQAMAGVAFYCFLAFLVTRTWPPSLIRKAILIFLPALALTISFARVYLGVHYASDVVAGMILGAIIAWASIRLVLWLEQRLYSEEENDLVIEELSEVHVAVSE